MRANQTDVLPGIVDVLRVALVTETSLTLTGRLDRPTYAETAEVLARIGGKWNRKEKAHLFETADDVRGLVAEIIATGQMPRKNELAYFPTPPHVVERMLFHFGRESFEGNSSWLEPSAGEGNILDVLVERGVEFSSILAVEFDSLRHTKLIRKGYNALCSDFLNYVPGELFGSVIMNPPFSKAGFSTLYIDHILHAWEMVEPKGMLVSIAPSSLLYRTDAKTTQLRKMASTAGFIEELPSESFQVSGTGVSTVIVGIPGQRGVQLLVPEVPKERTKIMGRKKAETTLEMPLASTPPPASEPMGRDAGTVRAHVDELVPNPLQPRQVFKDEEIEELAQQIKDQGLLQPPMIRFVGETKELIYGERRTRAIKLLVQRGEHDGVVDVKVRVASDLESLLIALAENVHRRLNAMELSAAFCHLSRLGLTQAEIGAKWGLHETTVGNKMRLSDLPYVVSQMLFEETLSEGHGIVLLGLPTKEAQVDWASRAVEHRWPVKMLGALVQEHLEAESKKANPNVFGSEGEGADAASTDSAPADAPKSEDGKKGAASAKDKKDAPKSQPATGTPAKVEAPKSEPAKVAEPAKAAVVPAPKVAAPTPAPAPNAPFVMAPVPQPEHFFLKQKGFTAGVALAHFRRTYEILAASPNLGRILEADGMGGALDYLETLHPGAAPIEDEAMDEDEKDEE